MLAPTPNNVVQLTGILDVRTVGDVRQTLNTVIDTSVGDVIVDLERVDAVDATGLGLLIDVRTVRTYNEARVKVSMLKDFGIKATAARTKDGWTVYVWPNDEAAARGLLDTH